MSASAKCIGWRASQWLLTETSTERYGLSVGSPVVGDRVLCGICFAREPAATMTRKTRTQIANIRRTPFTTFVFLT